MFTSFSVRSVAALARHSGAPRAGLIVDRNTDNAIDLWREWIAEHRAEPTVADLLRAAKDSGATLIAASQTLMETDGFEAAAHAAGFALMVWTVNNPAAIGRYLADPMLEAVITDRPDLALALRSAR